MLTRRRALSALAVLVLVAVAWTAWLALQTAQDLRAAEQAVDRIRAAISADDPAARSEGIEDLAEASSAAKDRTAGFWWSGLTRAPFVGDDMGGVQDLSSSLELLATKAFIPLGESVDELDALVQNGRIDVAKLEELSPVVEAAHVAFTSAAEIVRDRDSSSFAGILKSRYEEYVSEVSDLARDLGSADDALEVLPSMLGGEGPRQYLLIFENNAEIRATGGLPGSWAQIKAQDGELTMARQGSASDFDAYSDPIGGITNAEAALFGREMGRFFQDPNFTPDFPRAAQVFNAFWSEKYPRQPIDGVISIDTVALSYILEGTGPVQAGGLTLTPGSLVDQLLSGVYEEPDPRKQDEVFRRVAKEVFDTATRQLSDPVRVLQGVVKATREGRFKVAPFVTETAEALAGTGVTGELSGDDGTVPHVDIALNDATASKMSYYLRYTTRIQSVSCSEGRQILDATISLSQTINQSAASALPEYVTGTGLSGQRAGSQLVRVHVFAPFQGSISSVKINGRSTVLGDKHEINGRPAITLAILIDSLDDVVVTLNMVSGQGQTSAGVLKSTPSVIPGSHSQQFHSSC
jgi:hypothetical protein